MNDLDVLRDLRARVPEPSSATIEAGRARLTAAIQTRPSPQTRRGHAATRRNAASRSWHPILTAGALTTLAVIATVVAVSVSSADHPVVLPGHPAARHPVARGNALKAELASKVLRRAAAATTHNAAATHNGAAEPSSGQWFYSKTVDYEFGSTPTTSVDEEWSTFDGKYTAYNAGGQLVVHHNPGDVIGRGATALDRFDSTATARTAYQALASLPSDPAALISVISAHVATLNPNQVLSPVEQYAPTSSSQVTFSYLVELMWNATDGEPPAAQASVYLAMARLPGVTVQQGITDAAGQPAIAVSDNGGIDQLLLNPRSYAVVGIREVSTGVSPARVASKAKSAKSPPWPPRGAVLASLAISELKPVSGPGRR